MAMDIKNPNIAGSDGIVPVYDPDGRWAIWAYQELWFGKTGKNKYVPKVNDYVVDYTTNTYYIVVSLNTELVPTLKELTNVVSRDLTDIDNILRSKRRTSPDSYRIYLDTSVNPHKLTIDSRFTVGGTFNTHAQIFKGSKLDQTDTVISTIFDQYGELVSTMIKLELVKQDGMNNHCEKCVPPCYTTAELADDEIVTVVIYNDEGGVTSIQEFYVYNTAVIRQTDTNQKYIKDITLESDFMSKSDPHLLEYPLNVPVRGLNLMGVVHYSDGSKQRMPVDGTKFSVHGLHDYVATIIGYEHEFTLTYNLSKGEVAVGLGAIKPGDSPYITTHNNSTSSHLSRRYVSKTVMPDGAYNVKLYGYPVWVDENTGYELEWFLFNLERSIWKKVTPYVRHNRNPNPQFNGTLYGISQRLSISIDLKDIGLTTKQYIHTQVMDVALERNGTDQTNYHWSVNFEITGTDIYGIDNWAKVKILETDKKQIDISQSETNLNTWLNRMWKRTKPLYDKNREAYAPTPDMFTLVIGDVQQTYSISQWNRILEVSTNLDVTKNVYIVFHKRTNDTDLFLGIAGLPVFVL
jgi:hypothetical protein